MDFSTLDNRQLMHRSHQFFLVYTNVSQSLPDILNHNSCRWFPKAFTEKHPSQRLVLIHKRHTNQHYTPMAN